MKAYTIAEIAITSEGKYLIQYLGEHPEQGGINFSWGGVTLDSLEGALGYLKYSMKKSEEEYKRLLSEKK